MVNIKLLANGASGAWSVTLDETTDGDDAWFLTIEGPSLDLFCQVSSPTVLDRLKAMLDGSAAGTKPLLLGQVNRIPLRLQRDGHSEEAAYFTVGPASRPVVRYSVRGADLDALTEAVRQAALDLTESDAPVTRDSRAG